MKPQTLLRAASLLALTALMAPSTGLAAVIYTQNFNNAVGGGALSPVNTTISGGNAYISNKAFNMAGQSQYNFNNDATPPAAGVEQAYVFSPSGANGSAGYLGGYLVMAAGNTAGAAGTPIFATTLTGLNINIASYTDMTISWQQNKSAANTGTIQTRILLQIGGQWYASATAFSPVQGAFSELNNVGASASLNFNPAASNWNTFNLAPGSATNLSAAGNGSMSMGSISASDLGGTITGIGFYSAMNGVTAQIGLRYDQLAISATAIPEPSGFAALAGAVGLGLTLSRRRRSC